MRINAEKLAERVAELSRIFRQQQEKFGAPGYDPSLVDLLHSDITALKEEMRELYPMERFPE